MNILRYFFILFGLVLGVIGLVIAVSPLSSADVIVNTVVERVGNDYVPIAGIGIIGLLSAVAVILARGVTGINQVTPPNPEGIPTAPRLGADFDQFIKGPPKLRTHFISNKPTLIRNRLRETAIQTVMHNANCSRDTARKRIDQGLWTDDPDAVAYLGGPDCSGPPLTSRFIAALNAQAWFQRGARRTANEIIELAGGDGE